MTVKIWRDQDSHPYAVLTQGRFMKVGKDARRQPVDRLMRRLYFTSGVGVAHKSEAAQPSADDPGSRQMHLAESLVFAAARSLLGNGPLALMAA